MGKDIFCTLQDIWRQNGLMFHETSNTFSILSVTPSTPGHSLVVPKAHVETLDELDGDSLQQLWQAVPETIKALGEIYQDPQKIVDIYKSINKQGIGDLSVRKTAEMLEHPNLRVAPSMDGYNVGINVGKIAGGTVDHAHLQLFPRREEGPGIATAMSYIL